ncbi:cilia- and flagella-associated protein 61-like isoform X2 [Diorhabda carinulata]|uniref:cilia- and flagella-associated protein 61-like isoform X2 n=1 Tax=Diorhabda carinulata TaxID=1163345 RepID=UPI0025A2948B|nr:cilia- and flagella-associated protein 61-like isoform X2 [Diorhabda carinulata]
MERITQKPSMSTRFKSADSIMFPHLHVIRLYLEHAKVLEKLKDGENTSNLFGNEKIEIILLNSYISLGLMNEDNKIVGAIFVNTHPNIPSMAAWEWEYWIKIKYGMVLATPRNTLFINMILYSPDYSSSFLKLLVHHLFVLRNFLKYAVVVIPPGQHQLDFLGDLGVQVLPDDEDIANCQYLYVFCRKDFQVQYKIRRAVEEDNDDLVPLIETHSKKFTELYGKYYIAEILMSGKELGRHIIVAEYQGTAVAVLCLNSVVNYKVLNEDFELIPYNGLKKPHPDDFTDLSVEYLPKHSAERIRHSRASDDEILDIVEQRSRTSETEIKDEEMFMTVSLTESDEFSLVFTSASMFVFQDDEDGSISVRSFHVDSKSFSSESVLSKYLDIPEKEVLDDNTVDWISGYSTSKGHIQKTPEFKGEDNAFSLEIAACLPSHEYGLIMLFESAFECFPNRDYCVMAVPTTISVIKLTKYFGRVPPRCTGTFPSELYVMHKNSMLGELAVEIASKSHEKQVKQLLSTIPDSYSAIQQFEISINFPRGLYTSFVCLCDKEVIGICILSEEIDLDYLTSHYDVSSLHVDSYPPGSHGIIESIVISPIFQRHDKFFLRDLHRLSNYSILFYRHTPYDNLEAYRDRPLINNLQNLLPILPIMQPEYDLNVLKEEECAPSEVVTEKKEPFALYVSTVNICSHTRHVINTKIIIVGCSNTALAFIHALVFRQSVSLLVTYNNITMICPNGFRHKKINNKIRDSFGVKKNFMDARYMDMINLKAYINIVQGKITKIDRKEQYVVVNNNSFLEYDMLFLMTGEQFQKPTKLNKQRFSEKPENVFVINSALDANQAVSKLRHLYRKRKDNNYTIIVYGHFLQAHATVNGLIDFGIAGNHLVLIEPFPYSMALEKRQRHNVSIYNNPEVDSVVYESFENKRVKIYSSYYFIDWTYDAESNCITKAKFESKHKMLEMECLALFFFSEKEISPRVYSVINNAGLVYDGRLVIDSNCQTNDSRIFGAGTLTKYSRKYFAQNMAHKYYNRIEIGKRLGAQIGNLLLPQKEKKAGWNFRIERGESLVPRYVDPIMRYCRLPGNLYYLSITKPGRRIPLETAVSMENYGQVLITGNCRNLTKQGYFQLHLNEFKKVETITCLHTLPIDAYNLHCLWGKHEKLLNNLTIRFEMVLITDLFAYFKEPWAYALYHQDFSCLLDELNMLMTSSVGSSGHATLINDLINLYKEHKWKKLPTESKIILEEKFKSLAYPKMIEQKVLNFLKSHLDLLPMYAHPLIIKDLLKNFSNSPLFT